MKLKELGRSMQETVYVKNGMIFAQGLKFERIEGKQ